MQVKLALHKSGLYTFYSLNKKIINALFLIFAMMLFGEIVMPGFLTANLVMQIIKLAAITGIFALCQTVIISVGGGLDLSVGYIATMSAVIAARFIDGKDSNLLLGLGIGLGIGLFFGMLNGLGVVYLKLPPLVMTMGMASILSGLINVYSSGLAIGGRSAPFMEKLAAKQSWGILPNMLIIWAIIGIIAMVVLFRTRFGKILFGVGANPICAELNGINVKRVLVISFVFSGAMAGICGQLLLGYIGSAMKDMGSIYVMSSIAACVVGGVSITGGNGNYIGVILGSIVLQTLSSILIVMGYGDAGKNLGFGLILLILLAFYGGNRRSKQ